MIENLRKYTGVMLVALVLVFLGLILFVDSGFFQGKGGGATVMRISGRGYSLRDYKQLGEGGMQLAQMLNMWNIYNAFGVMPTRDNPGNEEFFIHRILLDQAQDDFGVHPSEEEITRFLQEKSPFVREGKFDSALYSQFIQNQLGRYGLSEADVRELIRDFLAAQKIQEIIGAGLLGNSDYSSRQYASQNQKLTLDVAEFELSTFEEKQKPDEDTIKQFWEESKDAYKTLPRRKFSYVLVQPKPIPDDTEKSDQPSQPKEQADPATAKKDDPAAKKDDPKAAERRKAELELAEQVDNFLGQVEASKGGDFESLAKENGWEIKQTEMFTRESLPKELDLPVRAGGGRAESVADYLFSFNVTEDPLSKFTPAIPLGDNQWLIARLEEEQKEAVKTYAEARDEARAQLIERDAKKAMKDEAENTVKKLREALAAGKSFEDAAKDLNLKVKTIGPFSVRDKVEGESTPQPIFQAASTVDPGSLADPLIQADRALVIRVAKRELVKEENLSARIDAQTNQERQRNQFLAFFTWLAERRAAAHVEQAGRANS